MLPPLRRAGEVLGPIDPAWAKRTGLPADVQIHTGIHDSNAALIAARACREIGGSESTVLSTGTWFVAMRSPGKAADVAIGPVPEARDCLVNIDVEGRLVPSARFMGGREIESLIGIDTRRIDIKPDQPALLAAAPSVVAAGSMALPTFAPGFGPFAHSVGRWAGRPDDPHAMRAAVSLYAALVADTSLDLIGSTGPILIEGRFAEAQLFVRALAALRPGTPVYASNAHNDVSYGALRLIADLPPPEPLERIAPIDVDLRDYKLRWHELAGPLEQAA
jgi:sugar (pentulose or hexulose) kinase